MNQIYNFLNKLSCNNTREWIAEHQDYYKEVMAERDAMASRFIEEVAKVDPAAAMLSPRDVTYRLMRDTRFSQDKTPYKTHIGIFVNPPYGKKSLLSGYYLHLEPGESFICGGNYGLPGKMLQLVRNDIRDNIEEYISIVESPEFKQYFPIVGMEWLKTAPKGFDRNWEYINYVRPKEFGVMHSLDDNFIEHVDDIEKLHPFLVQIKRLNDFINFTLTESGLPLMRESR